MISSDPHVEKNTAAKQRIEEYRKLVDELHVVVIAGKRNMFAFFRAYIEGGRILRKRGGSDFLITAQDPSERWLVGWLLSRRFRVPLEVQVHTDIRSPYLLEESIKNRIRLLIAGFLLPRAACIRVVSARVRNSLLSWLPETTSRVTVLPVYVDVEKFRALHRIDEQGVFRFLMVSRLTREKNIALAIDAFAEVHAEFPHTNLIIVGDGPERRRLEAIARKKNCGKGSIVFTGWKEDVTRDFQYASCYLLTSNYEGYSRTVIEALALGVPVIMTDVGIAGDVVQHETSGIIIPVGDTHKLTESMRQILRDPYLRRTLSENGRAAAASYPSREQYLHAYKKMWLTCGAKKK